MKACCSPPHLLLILLVVLMVFGPSRLPELGHTLGRAIRDFRSAPNSADEADGRGVSSQRQDGTLDEVHPSLLLVTVGLIAEIVERKDGRVDREDRAPQVRAAAPRLRRTEERDARRGRAARVGDQRP